MSPLLQFKYCYSDRLHETGDPEPAEGRAGRSDRDGDRKIAELFDARRTSEVFLLDGEGRLRYRERIASKISSPDLRKALEQLLAGHEVKPAETKAFGCSIPRG